MNVSLKLLKRIDERNYLTEREHREFKGIVENELKYADTCHNLEKKLGCPLDIFIELHKVANVYTKMGKCKLLKILDKFIVIKVHDNTTYLPLSEYQKTWWLKENTDDTK